MEDGVGIQISGHWDLFWGGGELYKRDGVASELEGDEYSSGQDCQCSMEGFESVLQKDEIQCHHEASGRLEVGTEVDDSKFH